MGAFFEKFREKSWTVKVVPKSKSEMAVWHVTALDLLRISFLGFLFLAIFSAYFLTRKTEEKKQMQTLESKLQQEKNQLKVLQHQKEQVEALLNQKANKLEKHLESLKKQEEKIRQLLGEKNRQRNSFAVETAYHPTSLSSRGNPTYSSLVLRLASLQEEVAQQEKSLAEIRQAALERHEELMHVPSIWPVEGGEITSGFGYRENPLGYGTEFHAGVDIGASYDSLIHATASGVCIYSGWEEGYGYTVKIDHKNGFVTQYSHCSHLLVHVGQRIKKGDVIADVGSTGLSTGDHVHYAVFYRGEAVNPERYLPGVLAGN
jgi:murein DD-endopeptidase MepM/ murein hydrolase activator NlpD